MFFRKIKIRTKLLLVIGVFLILFVEISLFSFFALNTATNSFGLIQRISFPQILVSSKLKDRVHTALLAGYDYVATGNRESKQLYEQRFSEVFLFQIRLFEIAQTEDEFQISQQVNSATFLLKDKSDDLIAAFEANPDDPQIRDELIALSSQLEDFIRFITEDVETPIVLRADEASVEIEQRVRTVNQNLILSGVIALIVVILSLIFLRRSITKPIKDLVTAAADFAKGEFYPVKTRNRDELGVFAMTFTDMGDDIKKATRALEVELDKTKKLDQQKTEFLQVASHQLRTPMSGIKWLFRMLTDGDIGELTEEQLYHVNNGLSNADRMVQVINDLLEVTRVSQPRYAYNYEPFDIEEIIQNVAKQFEQNAASKNITLNFDAEKDLPLAEVDKSKFEILLQNLFDNAIKYTPEGKNIWVRLVDLDGNRFQLIVKDEGLGIPADQQDQIFKKFFRGRNVVQVDTLGSGLGLAMVKDITDSHEGTVVFESVENQGTTFWVSIPYHQTKPEGKEAPTLKTMVSKIQEEKSRSVKSEKEGGAEEEPDKKKEKEKEKK